VYTYIFIYVYICNQVKIDGFRIELSEIETVYASHKAVDKAVAIVRDKKIALYIKAVGNYLLSDSSLREINSHAGNPNPNLFDMLLSTSHVFTCCLISLCTSAILAGPYREIFCDPLPCCNLFK
jgi:hypothetical protein